ncbi:MAG: family 1 glycosylhydrolase [Candidatus Thorarchaeota archaeon]
MKREALVFPSGFLWGSAASAHQTEGGNRNDWSEWERIPGKIRDGTNSSRSCDHYNRYEEDFDLAKEYGHQVHRFSVEWSRIEPTRGAWNEREVEHYRRVVKALVDRGIKPMVTLHHFTNPIWFRDIGAWLNPESPDIFAPYCRKVAESLCEFDIIWNTINEPMIVSVAGYLFGEFPPGLKDFNKAMTVASNLLMAHGRAAEQIRRVYKDNGLKQPQIAPVLSVSYFMPENPDSEEDVELANYLDNLYNHRWISGAIRGEVPSDDGGSIRYPALDNSVDFIGLNYYSRMVVSSRLDFMKGEMPPKDPSRPRCDGLDWEFYPEGYFPVIESFWSRYRKPIFLTENGIGTTDDELRCRYIVQHLREVHRAISAGVDIRGYLVWSLTDNFEWAQGFSSRFGLIEVDYETLERRPRQSAKMFREIIQSNSIPPSLLSRYG